MHDETLDTIVARSGPHKDGRVLEIPSNDRQRGYFLSAQSLVSIEQPVPVISVDEKRNFGIDFKRFVIKTPSNQGRLTEDEVRELALGEAFTMNNLSDLGFVPELLYVAYGGEHPNPHFRHEHPYLVIEFVEGRSMKQFAGVPFNNNQLPTLIAIATGLSKAHERGTLHLDIKPDNIILPGGFEAADPKVIDWGLSHAKHVNEEKKQGKMVIGTPQYIAPEGTNGCENLDVRSEIYSFGAVLYERITGKKLFTCTKKHKNVNEMVRECYRLHREVRPKAAGLINPNIPWKLGSLTMQCLRKRPDNRPQTMGEVARRLVNVYNTHYTHR